MLIYTSHMCRYTEEDIYVQRKCSFFIFSITKMIFLIRVIFLNGREKSSNVGRSSTLTSMHKNAHSPLK